tara:strand:+ start:11 stop:232 length:222 start_codon:yes stop_codon:yes gene_type:complete
VSQVLRQGESILICAGNEKDNVKIAATVLALAVALPTIGSAGEGRYQGVTTGAGVFMYVLDTKTGEVITIVSS